MNVFDKSLFVGPGKVLGFQLKPFSAFHASALMLAGSPFINGGAPAWGDIISAVLICSGVRSDGLSKVTEFQDSFFIRFAWRVKTLFVDMRKVCDALNNHVACYLDYPAVGVPVGDGSGSKKAGAPWPYFMVSLLWQNTSAGLDELWGMPLNELCCHKAIYDELNGGNEIVTGLLEERERNTGVKADAEN